MSRLDRGNGICKNGHSLAEVGTRNHSVHGAPECVACKRETRRAYRNRNPKTPKVRKPRPVAVINHTWLAARADINDPDDCWPWQQAIDPRGYGRGRGGKLAHRLAYEALVGPIPDGMTLDHTCHPVSCRLGDDCPHRRCINPRHLAVTPLEENVVRTARRTECRSGHDAAKYGAIKPSGQRYCRECNKERCRARREIAA